MQDGLNPEGKWNGSWGPDSLEPDAKDAEHLHVCMFDKPWKFRVLRNRMTQHPGCNSFWMSIQDLVSFQTIVMSSLY